MSALVDAGFHEVEAPWFTHHHLELADLPAVVLPEGYTVRPVRPGEHDQRAAVHRAAWSATSKVTSHGLPAADGDAALPPGASPRGGGRVG